MGVTPPTAKSQLQLPPPPTALTELMWPFSASSSGALFPALSVGLLFLPTKGDALFPSQGAPFPVWVLMKGATLETSPDGSGPVSN